MGESFLVQF